MKSLSQVILALSLCSINACKSDDASDGDALPAPSALKAEPLDGGAHLTWRDNSDNEAEFMIERKMSGGDWMTIGTVPFDTASFHDPELMEGKTYMYRVMAMSKSGKHGSYSNEASCRAGAGPGAAGSGSMHDAHHPDAGGA